MPCWFAFDAAAMVFAEPFLVGPLGDVFFGVWCLLRARSSARSDPLGRPVGPIGIDRSPPRVLRVGFFDFWVVFARVRLLTAKFIVGVITAPVNWVMAL